MADFSLRIDIHLHARENFSGIGVHLGFIHQHAETAARFATDENVLGGGQMRHQVKFLMDDIDAHILSRARIRNGNFFAFNLNGAAVGLINTGENFHEGGFARPIFAHQGQHFTGMKVKLCLTQSMHAGKPLFDIPHHHKRRVNRRLARGLVCGDAALRTHLDVQFPRIRRVFHVQIILHISGERQAP